MPSNSKIPFIDLTDTLNTQRLRTNQLIDSIGNPSSLTTTADNITAAINEHDAELGTITAGAMGTTASTVSNAIAELDGRLDSINETELLSPRATLSDSSATNIVRGNLQVDTNLHVDGNITNTGSITIDGLLTSRANVVIGNSAGDQLYVNSSINTNVVPYTDNAFDLGSPTKEWRHVYVDGTVNADNVEADSATIGTLTVTGDTTFNNTITVQDSAYVTGDLDVGGNLDVSGNVEVTGDTTFNNTITVEDSAYITGNLDVGGDVEVSGDTKFLNTITVQDSAYVTGNLDVGGNLDVAGNITLGGNITIGDADTDNVAFNADINSSVVPNIDNRYDLGSASKEWRHVYVDGTVNADNVAADSATIGTLTVTGDTTLNNTITVEDSAYITGDLVLGSNLKTPATFALGADATSINIGSYNTGTTTIQHDLTVDSNLTVHGVTNLDSTTIVGFVDITGSLSVSDGFTVGGTFTTTGTQRGEASYIIVNDGVAVANGNRAGLAVDRPSNDSAVVQWNELNDYWEVGTTNDLRQIARQDDSAAFTNVYVGSDLTVNGKTIAYQFDSAAFTNAYFGDEIVVGGTTLTGSYVSQLSKTDGGALRLKAGGGRDPSIQLQAFNDSFSAGSITLTTIDEITLNPSAGGIVKMGTSSYGFTFDIAGGGNAAFLYSQQSGSSNNIQFPDGVDEIRINTSNLEINAPVDIENALTVTDSAYITGNVDIGGDLTVDGNFTVSGTTTYVNSTTVELGDNIIELNSALADTAIPSSTNDAGLEIHRGAYTNTQLLWDEGLKYWVAANDSANTLSRIATAAWLDATGPISFNSSTGNISHDNSGVTANTYGQTGTEDGQYIKSITVNATGHITGISADDFDDRYDNYSSWTLSGDGGSNQTISSGNTVDIAGGTYITTTAGATDTLTVSHDNTTRTNVSGSETLGSEDTFSVVDSIQTNTTGHVTRVGTRSFTLPAAIAPNDATITIDPGLGLKTGGNFTTDQASNETITLDLDSAEIRKYYFGAILPGYALDAIQVNGNVSEQNNLVGNIRSNTGEFYFSKNVQNTANTPVHLNLVNTDTSPADGRELGRINFSGADTGIFLQHYARIDAKTLDVSSGSEDGQLNFHVMDDGDSYNPLSLSASISLNANYTTTIGASKDVFFKSNGSATYIGTDQPRFRFSSKTTYNGTAGDPVIDLENSNQAIVNGEGVGTIRFLGENSASSRKTYASIKAIASDVAGGTEDGQIQISTITAGQETSVFQAGGTQDTIIKSDTHGFIFQDTLASTSNSAPEIMLQNLDSSPSDGNAAGVIKFEAEDTGGTMRSYASISGHSEDVTAGSIEGGFRINIADVTGEAGPGTGFEVFTVDPTNLGIGTTLRSPVSTMHFQTSTSVSQNAFEFSSDDIGDTNSSSQPVQIRLINYDNNPELSDIDKDIATIEFIANNSVDTDIMYAYIRGAMTDATSGTEDGKIEFYTRAGGSPIKCASMIGNDLYVEDAIFAEGSIFSYSDARLKENIETVENGLDLVSQLRGVWYNRIGKEDREVGVIAQEVEEVLPEVVNTDNDGTKSVDYGKMVGVLIEAIKELKQEIEELKGN